MVRLIVILAAYLSRYIVFRTVIVPMCNSTRSSTVFLTHNTETQSWILPIRNHRLKRCSHSCRPLFYSLQYIQPIEYSYEVTNATSVEVYHGSYCYPASVHCVARAELAFLWHWIPSHFQAAAAIGIKYFSCSWCNHIIVGMVCTTCFVVFLCFLPT